MLTRRPARLLQAGFTLIELIIVIVIIGILAAVAIPIFTDTTTAAQTGVLKGVGAAMASASTTNYALKSGGVGGRVVASCGDLSTGTPLFSKPTEVAIADDALTDGTAGTCTLTYTGGSAPPYAAPGIFGAD